MTTRPVRPALLFAAILLITAPASMAAGKGGGGGKPPEGRSVTSTMLDVDAGGNPYRIHSDSPISGTQTYSDGADSMISQLQPGNEWVLDGLASSTRKFFFDFRDTAGATPPFETGFVQARVTTKCLDNSGSWDGYPAVGNMTGVGSTLVCPAVFRFDMDNGDYYRVRLGWQRPETDQAKITCTHVAGTDQSDPNAACDAWTFEPAGADGRGYANLEGILKVGRNKTEVRDLGYVYVTYRVAITEP